jgi:uncharacterized protein (UPF0210 family)
MAFITNMNKFYGSKLSNGDQVLIESITDMLDQDATVASVVIASDMVSDSVKSRGNFP